MKNAFSFVARARPKKSPVSTAQAGLRRERQ